MPCKSDYRKRGSLGEFEVELSGGDAGEYGVGLNAPIVVFAKSKKAALKQLDLPSGVRVRKITKTGSR